MLLSDPIAVETRVAPVSPPWALPTRIAFQFSFIYFSLYVLLTQTILTFVGMPLTVQNIPELGASAPARRIVQWVATHVFGVTYPLVMTNTGSGDKTYDWVLVFCMLIVAVAGTIAWSIFAARGQGMREATYVGLHKWFRLFLRFSLGATLITYGAVKAVPLQMPYPSLTRLLEPFGHFSPMGVLWASIGASRSYEIFTGVVELLAGSLLCIPQTATLGALLSLAATAQVFTLNMTYDVPVKLFSFHLVLMSSFLLAPDARRLLNVLVLNRPAMPSAIPPLGKGRRAVLIGVIAQVVFGGYLVGMNMYEAMQAWRIHGGGAPKSPLYGIWNVEYMSFNGVERSPLLTDAGRWRRVVFDSPTRLVIQKMDDTFLGYTNGIDMQAKSMSLTKAGDQEWRATFAIDQPSAERLVLRGEMDGRKLELRLALFPRDKFRLPTRGFHWIQESPFNR